MTHLLFKLRDVPDDEAEEIRELLDREGIEFYETPASAFLMSAGAVWVADPVQFERAKRSLEIYQASRALQARAQYRQDRKLGRTDTWMTLLARHPLRSVTYLLLAFGVLWFLAWPVLQLAR